MRGADDPHVQEIWRISINSHRLVHAGRRGGRFPRAEKATGEAPGPDATLLLAQVDAGTSGLGDQTERSIVVKQSWVNRCDLKESEICNVLNRFSTVLGKYWKIYLNKLQLYISQSYDPGTI